MLGKSVRVISISGLVLLLGVFLVLSAVSNFERIQITKHFGELEDDCLLFPANISKFPSLKYAGVYWELLISGWDSTAQMSSKQPTYRSSRLTQFLAAKQAHQQGDFQKAAQYLFVSNASQYFVSGATWADKDKIWCGIGNIAFSNISSHHLSNELQLSALTDPAVSNRTLDKHRWLLENIVGYYPALWDGRLVLAELYLMEQNVAMARYYLRDLESAGTEKQKLQVRDLLAKYEINP
ncbi:MAG TPA: hypothetical protein PK299_02230 [Anaerolineales bacterium]|nr:hypothetical protein [Anaerolineales bacterium]